MLHKYFRIIIRNILALLSKLVLKKHHPIVVGIIYKANSTLIRDYIYFITEQQLNTRRNIEKADSEFSIPLTVLGTLDYPSNYIMWIVLIVRTFFQLLYLKPYKHVLILDLYHNNSNISEFWVNTVKPDLIITSMNSNISAKAKIIAISKQDEENILNLKEPSFLNEYCNYAGIDIKHIRTELPTDIHQRFNILPAVDNSLIIDARYYYYPPKIRSVLEIAETFPNRKMIIADFDIDPKKLPGEYEFIGDINSVSPKKDIVYIVILRKKDSSRIMKKLLLNKLED